jgi:hypothetical protein
MPMKALKGTRHQYRSNATGRGPPEDHDAPARPVTRRSPMTDTMMSTRQDDGFGLCPHCHQMDGYANAGRSHRAYCKEHRVSWLIGANLFSDWRDQTEEEQRAIWEDIGLSTFKDIVPFFWPETLARAERERSEVPDDAVDEHPF